MRCDSLSMTFSSCFVEISFTMQPLSRVKISCQKHNPKLLRADYIYHKNEKGKSLSKSFSHTWISFALQCVAVPSREVSCCFIGTLQEIKQHGIGFASRSHSFVWQYKFTKLPMVVCRLRSYRVIAKALRLWLGVCIKGGITQPCARPETGA